MNDKNQILRNLKDIYDRWEQLLASLSEEQITGLLIPSNWTVKDAIAHLWGWQQVSAARAKAALYDREPGYPGW